MGLKLGDAVLYLLTNDDKLKQGLTSARTQVSSWAAGIGGLALKAGAAVVAAGAAAIGAAITGATKLAIDASRMQPIQDAFNGLASSLEGGGEAMLGRLQDASLGMTDNISLMERWNKAAQLISVDFASTLPDAMKYLTKVAASTGEDFNYLLNSYIVGVGRMSPMILDNLSVQVKEADALERAAEMFGVQESAVTENMKQMAMANLVLEQLAKNTESIPDLAGTAQQSWKSFTAGIKNFKNELGLKLLPLFAPLFKNLSIFANVGLKGVLDKLDPLIKYFQLVFEDGDHLNDWLTHMPESIRPFVQALGIFIVRLREGKGLLFAFRSFLVTLLPPEVAGKIIMLINRIRDFGTTVKTFILDHKDEIIGALKGIAIALGALLIFGVIAGLVSMLANPLTIIIALAGLLGAAWAGNWGGIRDKVTQFWAVAGPIFNQLVEWLKTNIPVAIQTVSDFWTNTLQPALQKFWEFMDQNIIPIVKSLVDVYLALWEKGLEAVQLAIDNWILPALKKFWEKLEPFVNELLPGLTTGLSTAEEWLKKVKEWFDKLAEAIRSIDMSKIFAFLGQSPSPLAIGLRTATEELRSFLPEFRKLSRLTSNFPAIGLSTPALPSGSIGAFGSLVAASAGSPAGDLNVTQIFNDQKSAVIGLAEVQTLRRQRLSSRFAR